MLFALSTNTHHRVNSITMGKKKNEGDQNQGDQNGQNNSNEENKSNPKGIIVLGVYLHCEGCVDSVIKCLRGFDGVEEIEPDMKNHKVVVKGKGADPIKVKERLQKKSGKHVDLISPIVQQKKQEKKEEKKPEPKVIEVLLKVYLHCDGCVKDIKADIHKMTGVQTVEADRKANQVKVRGTFEAEKLVEFVNKRLGKNAQVVKVLKKEEKKEGDKEKDGAKKDSVPYPNYPPNLLYAPQLFSDENPNACLIM